MLRITAPTTGSHYRLVYLDDFPTVGRLLLAIPMSPNAAYVEYDAASLSESGPRKGKEKPFRKLILDGDVPIVPPGLFGMIPLDQDQYHTTNAGAINYISARVVPRSHDRTLSCQSYRGYPSLVVGFTRSGDTTITTDKYGFLFSIRITWSYVQDESGGKLVVDETTSGSYDSLQNAYVRPSWVDPLYPVYPSFHESIHKETINPSSPFNVSVNYDGVIEAWEQKYSDGSIYSRNSGREYHLVYESGLYFWDEISESSIPLRPEFFDKWTALSRANNRVSKSLYSALYDSTGESVWSEVQEKAIKSSIIITNNMFMFVQDVLNLKEDFTNLAAAGKKFSGDLNSCFSTREAEKELSDWLKDHGKTLVQDMDNVYLPVKYGYGLTVAEALELGRKITTLKQKYRNLFSQSYQLRSRETLTTEFGPCKANYLANVRVADNKFSQIYAAIFNSGFWPKLTTAYDFIPYSFCVDWFISIGDVLEQADLYAYRCNLDLICLVKSLIIDNGHISAQDIFPNAPYVPEGTSLTLSYYKRWIEAHWDSPPFKLDVPLLDTSPRNFSHYTELTALVTQRL